MTLFAIMVFYIKINKFKVTPRALTNWFELLSQLQILFCLILFRNSSYTNIITLD
jgi:hypothetical protein